MADYQENNGRAERTIRSVTCSSGGKNCLSTAVTKYFFLISTVFN